MYSLSINQKPYVYGTKAVTSPLNTVIPDAKKEKPRENIYFGNTAIPTYTMRTELCGQDEIKKYTDISTNLDKRTQKNLEMILKNGILLNSNSNDRSTTLDNLHKIATSPRARGLSTRNVLKETINSIANPYIINQEFGNIPTVYEKDILNRAKANPKAKDSKIDKKSINVEYSSSCVSASIEFNLAKQTPAEFARFAEGLTSPNVAVDKVIDMANLTDKTLDSIYLLNSFEIPYEMKDFNKVKVTLAPDKNAIIRAQIQNNDKDYGERSLIDVLMQSTFMNVGSQQSYDSLTDIRGGKFNEDNKGLIEFEKTFTESIVQNKNKTSMTYQNLDEKGKLVGYTKDFKTMTDHITKSLAMGENVIIGYIERFKDPKTGEEQMNGHEITIVGTKKDSKGNLIFVCNDTDDGLDHPVEYKASVLLPKIHHAGLPQKIVENELDNTPNWVEGLKQYNQAKQVKV